MNKLKRTHETAAINFAAGKMQLKGSLNFTSVTTLHRDGLSWLNQQTQAVEIDCQQVERCDSSALALLVIFWRAAHARHLQINFSHLPQQLLDLAELSGLTKILPIIFTNDSATELLATAQQKH